MDRVALRQEYWKAFGKPSNEASKKFLELFEQKDVTDKEVLKSIPVFDGKQSRTEEQSLAHVIYPALTKSTPICFLCRNKIASRQTQPKRRNRRSTSITLGEVIEAYLDYQANYLKTKSAKESTGYYQRYLQTVKRKKLETVTRREFQQLHQTIGAEVGHPSANRTLELVHAAINYAIDQEIYQGLNLAHRIKKFRLKSRERFLDNSELNALFKTLDECQSSNVRDFVRISLFTSVRAGNILRMKWKDIHFQERTWHIHADESKNGRPHIAPLAPEVIEILKRRQYTQSYSQWVFPGPDPTKPMTHPQETFTKIRNRAGLKDIRIHDLRRTHASWQSNRGVSLPIVSATLGHRDIKSTMIYARLNIQPVREAVESTVGAMLAAASQGVRETSKA